MGILRKVYINMPTHTSFCLLCFGINFIFVVKTEQELIASSLQCFNTVIKSYDIWTHRYNWSLLPYCLIFINNIQVDMVNNIFLKDLNIFVFKKNHDFENLEEVHSLWSWCLSCVVWTWIQMILHYLKYVDKSWRLINELY